MKPIQLKGKDQKISENSETDEAQSEKQQLKKSREDSKLKMTTEMYNES